MRERRFQRTDVTRTADLRARKYFDEVRTRLPCRDHFGRRERTGYHHEVLLERELDDAEIEPGAGEELHSGIHASARGVHVEHRTGSHDRRRTVAHQVGNY